MLIISPEFNCSNEILTITAMLSGTLAVVNVLIDAEPDLNPQVPNVWLRPPNQRKEADAAKAKMTVPDGDHLTMLNVYNQYQLSALSFHQIWFDDPNHYLDLHDKNWAYNNYLSSRALAQAENVRTQLKRNMERYEIELLTLSDEKKMYMKIRQVLVCGFFMQIAHKEGDKGSYSTVKDNQVRGPICYPMRAC
jgi:pre-mRNA-splicing factor ATP-dependent RNA helicase DHX15/PRP43